MSESDIVDRRPSCVLKEGEEEMGDAPKGMCEIGPLASWSVSSCKPGFGVEQLVDPALETLWQ